MIDVKSDMARVAEDVEALLDRMLPLVGGPRGRVIDAMRYGCLGGGKRLRPYLLVTSAAMFDAPVAGAMRAAAALEMIHCYSLVHDDLPAMDDSALRRGRPTAHLEFDEATAILAGDGLLTMAFEVLADPATDPDAEIRARLISDLAIASGPAGMVGGQMIDLSDARDDLDLDGVSELQALKTGALIRYACEAGGVLGRASESEIAALACFAADLGLAFQVVDDLLDALGTTEELGKPAGQDEDMDKATFVKLLGVDGARAKADSLVDSARERLAIFGARADLLNAAAEFVVRRSS